MLQALVETKEQAWEVIRQIEQREYQAKLRETTREELRRHPANPLVIACLCYRWNC